MTSLTKLKQLAEKATPGPWKIIIKSKREIGIVGIDSSSIIFLEGSDGEFLLPEREDFRFVAACSPDVVLRMVAALEIAQHNVMQSSLQFASSVHAFKLGDSRREAARQEFQRCENDRAKIKELLG